MKAKDIVDYHGIGERIRQRRIEKGWKQAQLAEVADISTPYLSHIENAHTELSLPTLCSIANALQVTPNDLLLDTSESIQQFANIIAEHCRECRPEELKTLLALIDVAVEHFRSTK